MNDSLNMVLFGGGDASPAAVEFATEGIRLARKRQPNGKLNVVIIPTARYTREKYDEAVTWANETFGALGGQCSVLTPFDGPPPPHSLDIIAGADVFYVPGGNPVQLLRYWYKFGLTEPIVAAIKRGVVTIGISAGLIIWFEQMANAGQAVGVEPGKPWSYQISPGLGLLPGCCSPHGDDDVFSYTHQPKYKDSGVTRRQDFQSQLEAYVPHANGVCVDNNTALIISDNHVKIIGDGIVTLHLWQGGQLVISDYRAGDSFPLSTLAM